MRNYLAMIGSVLCLIIMGCREQKLSHNSELIFTDVKVTEESWSHEPEFTATFIYKHGTNNLKFECDKEQWYLSVKMGDKTCSKWNYDVLGSVGGNGPIEVFATDLNLDGQNDYLITLCNGGRCGDAAAMCPVIVLLSGEEGMTSVQYETRAFSVDDFSNSDGKVSFYIRKLISKEFKGDTIVNKILSRSYLISDNKVAGYNAKEAIQVHRDVYGINSSTSVLELIKTTGDVREMASDLSVVTSRLDFIQ